MAANSNSPVISVIMITYNQEKYVGEAVQSILNQETEFPVEFIISNDGSADKSDAIIKNIKQSYKGSIVVKYFNQPENIGMMANFIFTLQQCTGKYIAVCEGDDYWTDANKLIKQLGILEGNSKYSMVFTNRSVLNNNNKIVEEKYDEAYKKEIFSTSDVVNGFVPGLQTILFRNFASLPDYFMAHPEYYYGDRYLAYFCSLFGDIYLLKDNTAVYRMTGEGVWSKNTPLEKLHCYTKFMEDFHKSLGIPNENEILARYSFDASYATLRYCLKRPGQFKNKEYRRLIMKPWNVYKKMNRSKIFLSTMFNRENKK